MELRDSEVPANYRDPRRDQDPKCQMFPTSWTPVAQDFRPETASLFIFFTGLRFIDTEWGILEVSRVGCEKIRMRNRGNHYVLLVLDGCRYDSFVPHVPGL
jgi:hypothetical protein